MNITLEQLKDILEDCDVVYSELDVVSWEYDKEWREITISWTNEDGLDFMYKIDESRHIILCENTITGHDTEGTAFMLHVFAQVPYVYVAKK